MVLVMVVVINCILYNIAVIKLSENFYCFFDFIQYVIIIHNFIKFNSTQNTSIQFIYILLSYTKVSMIILYFILMYVVIYNQFIFNYIQYCCLYFNFVCHIEIKFNCIQCYFKLPQFSDNLIQYRIKKPSHLGGRRLTNFPYQ